MNTQYVKGEYKVEVFMHPDYTFYPTSPFFWCLLKWSGDDWSNEGAGWGITYEEAWSKAKKYYQNYKKENTKKYYQSDSEEREARRRIMQAEEDWENEMYGLRPKY